MSNRTETLAKAERHLGTELVARTITLANASFISVELRRAATKQLAIVDNLNSNVRDGYDLRYNIPACLHHRQRAGKSNHSQSCRK